MRALDCLVEYPQKVDLKNIIYEKKKHVRNGISKC